MLMKKNWVFEGESGKKYTFELFSKSAHLPEEGGIYILTYTHPRGHLAGFQINILCVAGTDNLSVAVSDLQGRDSLLKRCWNYNYILCIDDTDTRKQCLRDLIKYNPELSEAETTHRTIEYLPT